MPKKNYSPENYSFTEGWKDGKFDPTKLSLEEQKKWGETLGMTSELISKKQGDEKCLYGNPWNNSQINFYQKRLEERKDFRFKEKEDGRFHLYIYNPSITYFYENELPPVGPKIEDSIISGLITNCAFRTITHGIRHRKVVWITKNETIAKNFKELLDLKKIEFAPLDYFEEEKICYSVWFYNTDDVKRFLLEDFENLDEKVKELPNFAEKDKIWMVLYEQANLRRHKNYKKLKEEDKISIGTYQEELNDFNLIKKQLREAEALLSELNKSSTTLEFFENKDENLKEMEITARKIEILQDKHEEIRERLYGKKPRRKRKSNWYKDQIWKDMQAKRKAGEL